MPGLVRIAMVLRTSLMEESDHNFREYAQMAFLISLKKLGKPRNTLVWAYGTNPGTRLPVMFGSKTDNNAVSEALL